MEITIQEAVTIITQGGIIIYPTDTAYGMGCRIDDADAVSRLFTVRRRPPDKATPVLVDSIAMAGSYFHNPDGQTVSLMEKYWPGALTIVYYTTTTKVPEVVRGGGLTIGLRMPDHEIPLAIIRGAGVPIIGTSANIHQDMTPFSFDELNPDLISACDGVVRGACKGITASTVVDSTVSPPKILRQGGVIISSE